MAECRNFAMQLADGDRRFELDEFKDEDFIPQQQKEEWSDVHVECHQQIPPPQIVSRASKKRKRVDSEEGQADVRSAKIRRIVQDDSVSAIVQLHRLHQAGLTIALEFVESTGMIVVFWWII